MHVIFCHELTYIIDNLPQIQEREKNCMNTVYDDKLFHKPQIY